MLQLPGMKPHSNFNMYRLVVTVGGGTGVVFLFLGFFACHHPELKLFQALPRCASWCHSQEEQDVWQNQTSALGLSHRWGWS